MDGFFDISTLIVIGLAIIVLFRLRSVLGTRTGLERNPLDRAALDKRKTDTSKDDKSKVEANKPDSTVVPMRPRAPTPEIDAERQARRLAAEIDQLSHGDAGVAEGLKAVAEADAGFSPKSFLDGAKAAYEMIVVAFAEGDRKSLKNLLEKDVYDGFERAIADREALGHKIDFTFVGLPKIEISAAELDKRGAQLTVRFDAEVVSATKDGEGVLLEGSADQVKTIADEWTFSRNPKSRDPNWKLVATNQLA